MNVHSDLKSIGSAAASSTKGLYLKNFTVKKMLSFYSKFLRQYALKEF